MNSNSVQRKEVRAVSKFVRMSPSKIRRVLRQIQGKTYPEALLLLEFMPYASCAPIIKVLRSATANGRNNFGFDETFEFLNRFILRLKKVGVRLSGFSNFAIC